eukprot:2126769-Rhodomonas_salina.3
MSSTDITNSLHASLRRVRYNSIDKHILLPAPYAMPSTNVHATTSIILRGPYAMSGTDVGAATRLARVRVLDHRSTRPWLPTAGL